MKMWKPGFDKALFLQTEGDAVVYSVSQQLGGEHRAQKIQHTHTHERTAMKRKGKKPSLNIMLAALLELLPQRVFAGRQGSPQCPLCQACLNKS
jgi:hypothetical protein